MTANINEMRRQFDDSPFARMLGMKIAELSPGHSKVSMEMREDFKNWDMRVQGGLITSLLDQAFGSAMNTLGQVRVAVQLNVNFIATPDDGDTLFGEAKMLHAGKTLGIAEMTVTTSKNKLIAKATGTTVTIGER